ncbi:hypothetical protein GCM10025857_08710 [Alicyclobacillus contaminans]|uniref:DegT/DnrJ/EryC1/StrS family aminotransferase n=1 Tax=Alicyclobacillus contaminans TaxID=392016 RepID=UPI00041C9C60|nr:DegT/DnrJ/EryC1/StrS family aminotransferase [Alicyclobacillus contaminans]GMA49514.1 hypothetical protein GCM10025857_08710 [Alicyclobacillus contaminans]
MIQVPLLDLSYQWRSEKDHLLASVERVLERGQYILGPEVRALEQEIAAYCGVGHAVAVGNGTDALILLLKAFDIGPGDEVITTPFTFFATAEAIVQVGATPVFADVDPATYLLTAAAVEKRITARTKAILVVHLFGQMADMTELGRLAEAHRIHLLEDACQSIGAAWDGHGVGSQSDGAALSFFPTKNLGAYGDGGMVLMRDEDRALRLRRLRVHGSVAKYVHQEIGWNSRLDELQAAMLRVKLQRLDAWTNERIAIAQCYHAAFADLPVHLPRPAAMARHVYHLYTVTVPQRDQVQRALAEDGIQTGVYYPIPLHLQEALRSLGHQPGDFPVSEQLAQQALSLPLYPGMEGWRQDAVIRAFRKAVLTLPKVQG